MIHTSNFSCTELNIRQEETSEFSKINTLQWVSRYLGYLFSIGNTPMKILVLVMQVRIIDVSVDPFSILTSKCIQRDKLTIARRTPLSSDYVQINHHAFGMS